MKKWKREIMLMGSMLCLYGGWTFASEASEMTDGYDMIYQQVLDYAETFAFPGIVYKNDGNLHEQVIKNALRFVPLIGYLEESGMENENTEDQLTYEMLVKMQEEDEEIEDVSQEQIELTGAAELSLDKLKNYEYLISKFYTVDSVTYVKESDFPVEEMLAKDFTINKEEKGPKVLVFHTHSQEAFVDSAGIENGTIVSVGEYLTKLLNEVYDIETLHHVGVYDKVDGKLNRSQAYERAKPDIKKILEENPTIEVVIDLHRDGVGANTHLVTEVNGKQTAQIMFFNGMCRTRTNGDLSGMSNPFLQDNLAFSLQMKLAAEEHFPGFTRRNYLKGYRYNMDLMPRMLLIEAGAQTNTVAEVMNAMEPLAALLNEVLTY